MTLNRSHDPVRTSWVESANEQTCDFPLQNLPYGVFRSSLLPEPRIGAAIGLFVLDLAAAARTGLLAPAELLSAPGALGDACQKPTLNALMSLGRQAWTALRARLSELLGADTTPSGSIRSKVEACLVPVAKVEMLLPARIGDYTDFYASLTHATTVGSMFRPDQPLFPNYKWIPVGYHGRSSSIVVSDTPVRRPYGQAKPVEADRPNFGPTGQLDYELEMGVFVGPGNPPGTRLTPITASERLFGVVLLNDWSARDIQSWEYQPLGPFLAKNFATSLSPWIVTMEALAPFRLPVMARPAGDPAPLPYLTDSIDAELGAFDIQLEAWILTAKMRETGRSPHRLSSGNLRSLYWTLAQLLTHHASNGCNLSPGDLLGTGTVSGDSEDSRGCLLELTRRGTVPITLPNGETRRFLEDGDEVILRGFAERPGARRIGLGECRGIVLPAA